MSISVSGGVVINLLQNGDNLSTTLNSTAPLYQTYKKGTGGFSPDWEEMTDASRPRVYPRVYSVMESSVLQVSNIVWKYNGVTMTFDEQGVCTAPDIAIGKVAEIDYQGTKALKMIGNVASETNNDSDTISFSGSVLAGGQTVNVSAEITLLIEEASSSLYRLFLNMSDDVIDGDETSLTMTAALYNAGVQVTTGVEFLFASITGTTLRSKGSSPTFTITREMIDSELMVVCKAYIGDTVVAQEQRQVWDSTDPFTIICSEGSSVRQSSKDNATYNFTLLNARTGSAVSGTVFTLKVIKNSDTSDITSEFTKTNTSITVPGTKILEHKSLYIDASCTVNL